MNNNDNLAKRVAIEGMVLLKNDNNVLPIKDKTNIALFGSGARFTIKGGTGSGEVNVFHSVSIEEGLKNHGFIINSEYYLNECANKLDSEIKKRKKLMRKSTRGINPFNYEVMFSVFAKFPEHYAIDRELTIDDYNKTISDTCIYVISRQAGEGFDRKNIKGDYYLTDIEEHNLKFVTEHYKNVIVIINSGAPIDTNFIDKYDIKCVVLYGQAGQSGGDALAELLLGESNFSGKLTISWPKHLEDLDNFKYYSYLDGNESIEEYKDGIYVGYRYYDSFGIKPMFPFGYGLSYTKFNINNDLYIENNEIIIKSIVKNIGNYKGKEVIQVYSRPIDFNNKEYQSLIGFKKTKLLDINEEEELILNINLENLASYHEDIHSFVIDKGYYEICIGNSSDNLIPIKNLYIKEDIILDKHTIINDKPIEFEEIKPIVHEKWNDSLDIIEVNLFNKVNKEIEKENINLDIVNNINDLDLCKMVVGRIAFKTYSSAGVVGEYPPIYNKYNIPIIYMADGPAGLRLSKEYYHYRNGINKGVNALPKEFIESKLFYAIVNKIMSFSLKKKRKLYTTAFPSALMQAQSFDPSLIYKVGEHVKDEMIKYNVDIWLAPGMNIIKNPLCGRTFEYYSEDPLVSGIFASSLSNGVSSNNSNKTVCFKHFCCNNQENNRMKTTSNVSERALHEIYLRGFKIAILNGSSKAIMTSYNKLNGIYTNSNKNLLNEYLRNDLGFKGIIMTDWNDVGPGQAIGYEAINAGNDIIMIGGKNIYNDLYDALNNNKLDKNELKTSVARLANFAIELKQDKK